MYFQLNKCIQFNKFSIDNSVLFCKLCEIKEQYLSMHEVLVLFLVQHVQTEKHISVSKRRKYVYIK